MDTCEPFEWPFRGTFGRKQGQQRIMDTERLTQIIVDVLKRHPAETSAAPNPGDKALVILDETCAEPARLRALHDIWPDMQFVLLNGGCAQVPLQDFGEVLDANAVPVDLDPWMKGFTFSVLPEPSLRLIAGAAQLVADEAGARCLLSALSMNMPVYACTAAQNRNINSLPTAMRKEAEALWQKLLRFGVRERSFESAPGSPAKEIANKAPRREILTLDDVRRMIKEEGEVRIGLNTRLTSLAKDHLRDNKIPIQAEPSAT